MESMINETLSWSVLSYNFWIPAISILHGPHQVAHRFKKTTFHLKPVKSILFSSRSLIVKLKSNSFFGSSSGMRENGFAEANSKRRLITIDPLSHLPVILILCPFLKFG